MKRGITDILDNNLVSQVKKQKVEKSLNELLNEVANGQFKNFQKWLQETNTTDLNLDSKIKDTPLINNLSNLGKALQDTPVTAINLALNAIGPQSAKDLAIGLKDSNVTALYLFINNLGPQGAKGFAEGLKGSKITTVDLMSNNLGPLGAKNLAIGLKGTNVTTVNLWSNKIDSQGAKDFAEDLKSTEITTVDLAYNKLGNQGAKDLVKGLKDTLVSTLFLEFNNISEQTATDISAYIPGTYLLEVNLGFHNKALSKALELNNQKLVLAPYYLACLNYLLDDEKLKYKNLPQLDQASTSEDMLKFAGGIFMYLPFRLRRQVLGHLPLMDQKSRANTYLKLAAQRQDKIQIEDPKIQECNEEADLSRSSSWGCTIG